MSNRILVLASTSKYRAQLLRQLGVEFEVYRSEIDESVLIGESPRTTCLRLAVEKARNGARAYPDALIIGSDQVLDFEGEAVSKPETFERAFAQVKRASGKSITSHTAVALYDMRTKTMQSDVVDTLVEYRDLADAEITAYLNAEQPFDCAGAVKVETRGIALLRKVTSDDPTALIGLPLIRLTDFLRDAGFDLKN